MSCSDDQTNASDALGSLDDAVAAVAVRRLVRLLQHRSDAANIELMGLAGFCRNCLGDWIAGAGDMDKEAARAIVAGMPTTAWKTLPPTPATPGQLARTAESQAKNPTAEYERRRRESAAPETQ